MNTSNSNVINNSVVSIHFTLHEKDGELLDTTQGKEPLVFLIGHGNIIKGLESALEGKSVGDNFEVTIKPEDAYGPIQEEAIQSIPLTAFEDVEDLDIGMRFHLQTDMGPAPVTITHIEDGMVTIDPHHPFAGKTLQFQVEIIDIRSATSDELEQGNVQS